MSTGLQRLFGIQVRHLPISNLQVDAIVATAAAVSTYLGHKGPFLQGLQGFVFASVTDRCIKWIIEGDFRIGFKSGEKFFPTAFNGVINAVFEEGFYAYFLLTQGNRPLDLIGRLALSALTIITASAAFRHPQGSKEADFVDVAIALGWTALREIVIQKTSSFTSSVMMVASNAVIFGLIERHKFKDPALRNYKFFSGMAFRVLCDLSAMKDWKRTSLIPPLTTHIIFNLSRSFRG